MQSSAEPGRMLMAALVAAALPLMSGCGDRGPRRYRISGTVACAGKPVPLGRIVFDPDIAQGNAGPQGFAAIENGRYDTSAPHCKGTVGGPMVVRIDGVQTGGGEDVASSGRSLFPTHELRVDLPKSDTTRDFDVPAARSR